MKTLEKALTPLFVVTSILASCSSFVSTPATSPSTILMTVIPTVGTLVVDTEIAQPTTMPISHATSPVSPTPLLVTDSSTPVPEQIVYCYYVPTAESPPEGSVVIYGYTLALAQSDITPDPDTATNLRIALETTLNDSRNEWISSNVEIADIAFENDHVNVVLQGEYFGVGDVTLIAARFQILLTVFANTSVETATVTLNEDTIANMGVSSSMNAKPADYVFTRAELETLIREEGGYVVP